MSETYQPHVFFIKRLKMGELAAIGTVLMNVLALISYRVQYQLYDPQYGETTHYYWFIFLRTANMWFFLVIVAVILALMAFADLSKKEILRSAIVFLSIFCTYVCGFFAYIVLSLYPGTIFNHIESIHFNGRTYHLALVNTADRDWDTATSSFIVYSCDSSGITCQVQNKDIDESFLGTPRMGKFVIDEPQNVLYVQTFQVKIPIA